MKERDDEKVTQCIMDKHDIIHDEKKYLIQLFRLNFAIQSLIFCKISVADPDPFGSVSFWSAGSR